MFCAATVAVMSFLGLAEPAPAPGLDAYVGRYPFEPIGCTGFFEEPRIVQAIAGTAGEAAVSFIQGLDAAPPVARQEDALLAMACSEDDCEHENAALAVSADGRLLALCLHSKDGDHGGRPGETLWLGETMRRTVAGPAGAACPHEPEQFLEAYARARS
jgi:hypothetical protein